jgi:N-acetylmuramoyl-L-alanine amidase
MAIRPSWQARRRGAADRNCRETSMPRACLIAPPASGLLTAHEYECMSPKLRLACNVAIASSMIAALASTGISEARPGIPQLPAAVAQISTSDSIQPTEAPDSAAARPASVRTAPARAVSLASLVTAQPQPSELPRELNCLAGAVYFEAKSESLSGQLAVGRVVVARSKSGRFPNSYCGVVFQPSQFSFVRGGGMPGIARSSRQWRNAVAIAQIAHAGSWRSPVEGALYFHAARVSPGWRLARVGRLENHVFYR